jgi:hypothetical protein
VNNDDARQYFKDKGLTYNALSVYTIDLLATMLQAEIMEMRKEAMIQLTDCILVRINPPNYTKKQLRDNKFSQFELTVQGTYFDKREAITFNRDGFIGFAGWACTSNTKPFIDGFIKWCDYLSSNPELLAGE